MASLKEKFERRGGVASPTSYDPLSTDHPVLLTLSLDQIRTDPDQPRRDIGDIEGLVTSIREHGILQPLIVSPCDDESFQLVAGERRFTAARAAGLEFVPAIVRTIDQHRRLEIQLVENLHRKDLNPLEEAFVLQRLIDEFRLTQRDLASRVGKSATSINQTLRILSLPKEILAENPTSDRLSRSVLLEMVKLGSSEEQLAFWRETQDGTPTVRQARAKRKDASDRPANYRFPKIHVPGGYVVVTVEKEYGSIDDLKNALEAAVHKVAA